MWDKAQVILWIKRSNRYLPYIEKALKENGMPDDIKYLAIVESGLLPHIGSAKSAVGYWQFIPATGQKFGLRVDENMDERRNFFSSTRAAIQYLKQLYGQFGSWTLAAAAYNMGENGLSRDVTEQKTRDYYHLYLPLETQRYIFKILAAKMILTDLKKYGFDLTPEDLYPPRDFDQVNVEISQSVSLMLIAEAAGTYFKVIKDLNPEIRGNFLVAGDHFILIPKGASQRFYTRFPELLRQYQSAQPSRQAPAVEPSRPESQAPEPDTAESRTSSSKGTKKVHVVKKGESISTIAAKYGVSVSELMKMNNLKSKTVHKGQRLTIRK
jgi:hypothetical protein